MTHPTRLFSNCSIEYKRAIKLNCFLVKRTKLDWLWNVMCAAKWVFGSRERCQRRGNGLWFSLGLASTRVRLSKLGRATTLDGKEERSKRSRHPFGPFLNPICHFKRPFKRERRLRINLDANLLIRDPVDTWNPLHGRRGFSLARSKFDSPLFFYLFRTPRIKVYDGINPQVWRLVRPIFAVGVPDGPFPIKTTFAR